MPGPSDIARGNIQLNMLLGVPLVPVLVALNSSAEQPFTIQGLQIGDVVSVTKPTAQAGLAATTARVSAANTLQITYVNDTAGNLTPTAETYLIEVNRPSNLPLPTAIT